MIRSRRSGVLALAFIPFLAGCAATGPSGRYVGAIRPDAPPADAGAASADPSCAAGRGVLDVNGPRFVFAPGEGVLVIAGTREPDGRLHGSLPLRGPPHGAGPANVPVPATRSRSEAMLVFTGESHDGRIEARLSGPRCSARIVLDRV